MSDNPPIIMLPALTPEQLGEVLLEELLEDRIEDVVVWARACEQVAQWLETDPANRALLEERDRRALNLANARKALLAFIGETRPQRIHT